MIKVDEAQVCLNQAQAHWQMQHWQETIQACAKAIAINQKLAKAHKLMGDALQKTGQAKEAIGYYRQAIAIEPDFAEAYANLGTLYAQQQQWQQSIAYYQQALNIDPKFLGVYRHLAKVWQVQQQPQKAQACLAKAQELETPSKQSIDDYLYRAKTLQQQGDLKAALQQYLEATKIDQRSEHKGDSVRRMCPSLYGGVISDSQRIEIYQEIVSLCEQLELWEEAAKYFRLILQLTNSTQASSHSTNPETSSLSKTTQLSSVRHQNSLLKTPQSIETKSNLVESKPNSAEKYYDLGILATEQQQWSEAIQHYQQAITFNPQMAKAYRALARALAQVGEQEKSTDYLFQAIALESKGVTATELLELGKNLASWKKYESAINCYRRAIEKQPDLISAYLGLGESLTKSGAIEQAIACYLQGLKYKQDAPELYYRLGDIYSQKQEWSKAALCYQKTTQYKSDHAGAYHHLGDVLSNLKKWSEAISAYQDAIQFNPDFSWSYNNLGYALIQLKRWAEAIPIYQNAIKLNPDFPWSYYNLAEALAKENKWDRAVTCLQKAAQIQSDLPNIQQRLGEALYQRSQQDREQALKHFQLALKQDPNNPEIYHQALAIDKANIELYLQLGNILASKEQLEQAIVTYQMALQVQPKNIEVMTRLQEALLKQDPDCDVDKILQSYARQSSGELKINQADFPTLAAELRQLLTHSEYPEVSIIIPVYNQLGYSLQCLKAIALNVADSTAVEIILINDCSSDQTKEILETVPAINLVNNQSNQGFIHSCNLGASMARGKYLYFLNNDTEIQPNCIESLIEVLKEDAQVGAVGSKLIYPDGALQEAGGIIWQDASGWNYGRKDNPNAPEYNFLRPVDYCSAASLMVRKEIFERLNGFERDFAPAYYEDTDLCFAIRHQLGLKVMYQPHSEVIHYEGVSSGTSTDSGAKQYQVVNATKFQQKWHTVLNKNNYLPNIGIANVAKATRKYLGHKTILVIDSYMPCYDQESGSRRLFELIKIFKSLNFHVIFAADNGVKAQPYTSILENLQVEVLYIQQGYSKVIEKQINARLSLIDIAWICRPELNEKYVSLIQQRREIKIIYDTIDLHYLRLKRAWELAPNPNSTAVPDWIDMHTRELRIAHQSDLTITVTSIEKEILQDQLANRVAVVPNIHIPYQGSIPSFDKRSGLLFIGNYNHPPNVDAVLWLCQEIMPLVWQQQPNIQVTLLGSNSNSEVTNLASDRIQVMGYIDDVSPYFLSHRLSVSPLRYGAGMKGKIGHSLEYALPVVSTKIGTEGMNLVPEQDILEANNTQDFAQQILRLHENENLWSYLSTNAHKAIAAYSPEKVKQNIDKMMQQLID
ncbi:tetratricopeptide repeat protein [Pleurocapsa sp. PCC 7319]|uniref:tetratricopeptide repeat protein n=1 Tax=Pleurocapsa sp. PCC 7319 TaxID=118161 RepID=UPI000344D177|nr:tetratricopeptide repeat protein [Pleurocapsa sp. PCC 7319]